MLSAVARTIAPRGARLMTTAARQPVAATSSSQSATISTTAKSIANPGPTASGEHIVSASGLLKSANRHFHANGSESSAGLSESLDSASARQSARALRMREAKEMAGL